jgi:hypothetical protein
VSILCLLLCPSPKEALLPTLYPTYFVQSYGSTLCKPMGKVTPGAAISLPKWRIYVSNDKYFQYVWTWYMAQTQHLNHEPQTVWNTLSSNELQRGDVLGHRDRLLGVR